MAGLLSILPALVLGTFAGPACTLYATLKSELETLGARIMQLNSALKSYGSETQPGREALQKALRQTYEEIWGNSAGTPPDADVKSSFTGTKMLDQYLLSLSPKTDGQKQARSWANSAATDVNKTRLLIGLQLAGGIPWWMLTIVICWSLLMFCGFGLVSLVNRTGIVALGFGAITIASAIFMIVQPRQSLHRRVQAFRRARPANNRSAGRRPGRHTRFELIPSKRGGAHDRQKKAHQRRGGGGCRVIP